MLPIRTAPQRPTLALLGSLFLSWSCSRQPVARKVVPAEASSRPAAISAPSASVGSVSVPSAQPVEPWGYFDQTCELSDNRRWLLRVDLPGARRGAALKALAQAVPGDARCDRQNHAYVELTTAQARALFGEHASLSAVPNAGNGSNSCGYFANVEPQSFVPAALGPYVRRLAFETDEKFELISELGECPKQP